MDSFIRSSKTSLCHIHTHKHSHSSECRPRLRGTGSVWESCENIVNVSRDNRAAVLKVVISQLHLLRDACSEVDKVGSVVVSKGHPL